MLNASEVETKERMFPDVLCPLVSKGVTEILGHNNHNMLLMVMEINGEQDRGVRFFTDTRDPIEQLLYLMTQVEALTEQMNVPNRVVARQLRKIADKLEVE